MRHYINSDSESITGIPDWDFTTDSAGRFTAKLGNFNSWEDKLGRPGWGDYAFVVDAASNDAGAVSQRIVHSQLPPDLSHGKNDWKKEWGDWIVLTDYGLSITLKVQSGVTLDGFVHDYTNPQKPLVGVTINANNDLGADTHSGHGGEILYRSAITDEHGHFQITHIYPATFHLGTVGPDTGFWLKTKYKGQSIDAPLDTLTPDSVTETISIDILATPSRLFRYYGRVVDTQGHPVPDAKVAFGLSFHPVEKTFEDDHSFCQVETDQNGQYEIYLGTPWVRGMYAEAVGYQRQDRWDDPTAGFRPGEYLFTLPPASPKQ